MKTLAELWQYLRASEYWTEDKQEHLERFAQSWLKKQENNLALRLLTGAGAVLAVIFLFGFIALSIQDMDGATMMVLGFVCLLGSFFTLWVSPENNVYETLTLVFNILGQILLAGGYVWESYGDFDLFLSVALVLQVIVFFGFPNLSLRTLSVVFFQLCLLGLLGLWEMRSFIPGMIGLISWILTLLASQEAFLIKTNPRLAYFFRPLMYGLSSALVVGLSISVNRLWYEDYVENWFIATLLVLMAVIVYAARTLARYQLGSRGIGILSLFVFILLPTWYAPGISAGFLLILIGFLGGYPYVLRLGLVALVYFLFAFYYNIQMSFFFKSLLLWSTGLILIGAYFFVRVLRGQIETKTPSL